LFGGNEMFHWCFTHWCAGVLQRDKIHGMQQDLEHNALKNHQEFMGEIYVAITASSCRTSPARRRSSGCETPRRAYTKLVKHEGAKVLLKYVR
jgi:hypothetical protein